MCVSVTLPGIQTHFRGAHFPGPSLSSNGITTASLHRDQLPLSGVGATLGNVSTLVHMLANFMVHLWKRTRSRPWKKNWIGLFEHSWS